ncbi:MAG: sugar porter family MFS transporter [Proteobacteria bacterium]|jgi:sugar porter (SP) family MFS transporter|nr:sugar porter family MFS transporter [Pseudomonadota bacterium]
MKKSYYLFILFIVIGGIACGYNISAISSTLPKIKTQFSAPNSIISLIAGLVFAGTAISKLSMSILNDTFGRRKTLIIAGTIFCSGTLSIIIANSINYIIIGRLLQGIGGGLLMFTISLYIIEMANDKHRGKLTALYQLSFTIGLLLANLVGMFIFDINWKISFILLFILTLIFISVIYYLPCSPRWLFRQGEHQLAYKALLIDHSEEESKTITTSWNDTNSLNFSANIFQAKYLKVLLLIILITLLNQFTGINAILQTSTTLITQAGLAKHAALLGSVGITAINVLGTIIGINIVERFPRNLLFGYCGISISLAHFIVAINFFSGYNSPIILLSGLMLFIIAFAIGPGIIIWLVFSEYLPLPVRSQGIAIAGFFNAVAGFFISSSFIQISTRYGMGWVFLTCAICSLFYGLIPIFYLPNTTGKDIEKFDELFKKS